MGTYAPRKAHIVQCVSPVRTALQQIIDRGTVQDIGPAADGWPELNTRLQELLNELSGAESHDDLQDTGRRAREILGDLARLVYTDDMRRVETDVPKRGDVKNRLDNAARALMPDAAHEEWRALIMSAWNLANKITHSTNINHVDAFAAAQATVLLVRSFEQAVRRDGQ